MWIQISWHVEQSLLLMHKKLFNKQLNDIKVKLAYMNSLTVESTMGSETLHF